MVLQKLLLFLLMIHLSRTDIVYFNELKTGSINMLNNTANSTIYVSASSDNSDFLRSIFFQSAGRNTTAFEILNNKVSTVSDEKKGWFVGNADVLITVTLPSDVLENMTGFMFINTKFDNTKEEEFHVIDLSQLNSFPTHISNSLNNFIVVLNSNPVPAITFSKWKQERNSSVNLFRVVQDKFENDFTYRLIFSNPVYHPESRNFSYYESIGEFSISRSALLLKTNGLVSVDISPGFVNKSQVVNVSNSHTGLISSSSQTIKSIKFANYTSASQIYNFGWNEVLYRQPQNATERPNQFQSRNSSDDSSTADEALPKLQNPTNLTTEQLRKGLKITVRIDEIQEFYLQYFIRSEPSGYIYWVQEKLSELSNSNIYMVLLFSSIIAVGAFIMCTFGYLCNAVFC